MAGFTLHFGKCHVPELNILNIMSNSPLTLETRQEKSSEVIIPVLEHVNLHFGSGRVSVLNIMNEIAISQEASLGP